MNFLAVMMAGEGSVFLDVIHFLGRQLAAMGPLDIIRSVLDILLLALLLYVALRFLWDRRAGKLLMGLAIWLVALLLSRLLRFYAVGTILDLVSEAGIIVLVLIFQPEIRDMLEHLGNITLLNPGSNTLSKKKIGVAKSVADETVDAVTKMSEGRVGCLIVFEGLTKLGDYIQSGKPLDAQVSSHLLQNIFFDKAPLHDGALVIRNMRIVAASCVLPATKGKMDFGTMGTRHRAAVGVTEVSDALVVVVSEETGVVSVAQDGKLLRDLDAKTLYDVLMTYMAGNAYLKIKRANMKKDYFDMLDQVARTKVPAPDTSRHEEMEAEFKKIIGERTSTFPEEVDSTMEDNSRQSADDGGGKKKD